MESVMIFVFSALVCTSWAYPEGPPVAAHPEICVDMIPQHGYAPMTSAAPYLIRVSDVCYSEGAELKARVVVDTNTDDTFFEGFFIQARSTDGSTTPHGTFDHLNTDFIQTLSCGAGSDNAIGHSAAHHYWARTFNWVAPAANVGDVRFVASIVRETDEIWLNVMSDVISYDANCTVTAMLADESFPDIEAPEDPCDVSESHQPESCGAASIGPISGLVALMTVTFAVLVDKH